MPRRRRASFRAFAIALVAIVQLPAVAALCWLTRTPVPLLVAVAASWPYLRRLESPWATGHPHPTTYLALGWWSACAVLDVLLVPVLLALHAGAPSGPTWAVAGALSLGLGIDAVAGWVRLKSVTVRIENLPPELDGYRIGHLSDVHCGPSVPPDRVATWVERLNALDLDLVAVTGDLISHGGEFVQAVAKELAKLKARDGAFASMGNHDYFSEGVDVAGALERHGLPVLKNRGLVVERGPAKLFVAGVDDTWTRRDDIDRALASRPAGTPTVLLAHDPDLFPEAQQRGVELTLSGHTHGGQLGVPGIRHLSLGRLASRWSVGLYRRGRSALYVTRGAGTTGPPARLGMPAELAVITLRRG